MFKKLKMKIAARRVERKKARTAASKKSRRTARRTFAQRVWDAFCAPFKWIARQFCRLWAWIRSIDLIGLVNLTLLVSIIVLFSMLIIDVLKCRQKSVVVVAAPVEVTQPQIVVSDDNAPRNVKSRPTTVSLPVKRDAQTREYVTQPINVVQKKPCDATVRQTARVANKIYGDTIIDGRGDAHILRENTTVNGNLYLQNMGKYILPCGTTVRGNLFLRDVRMLQFCGTFTVTGNIYVSPRSSFGPLPATARLGGQVIL